MLKNIRLPSLKDEFRELENPKKEVESTQSSEVIKKPKAKVGKKSKKND